MLKELIQLANHLDSKGFGKEADALDKVIQKMGQNFEYTVDPSDRDGLNSAITYRTENRDATIQMLEQARGIVVEANNLLVNEEPETSQTDSFYNEALEHMKAAIDSIGNAKMALTGHGATIRAGIKTHPDEVI